MDKMVIEVEEALVAADKTLIHLNNALKEINEAQNWGLFDVLGGKIINTLIDDYIETIHKQLQLANKESLVLKEELGDIGMELEINLDIGELEVFVDICSDNLSNKTTQSKLDNCEAEIKKLITEIERARKILLNSKDTY